MSLGSMLFVWATSNFGLYQSSTGIWFQGKQQALQERFVPEMLWFTCSGTSCSQTTIYIRNVGSVNVQIAAVYFNGTRSTSATYCIDTASACSPTTPFPTSPPYPNVGVQQVLKLQVNWSPALSKGAILNLALATTSGNTMTSTWMVG